MDKLTLNPITGVGGEVTLPGSKSLSNRILLLAAMSQGQTLIENLLDSDDIRYMLRALKALGVRVELSSCHTKATVWGTGGVFRTPEKGLFLGNAGTAYRPLTAMLATSVGKFDLVGEPRMEERPIGHLVDALQSLGADITYLKEHDYPPLAIEGKPLNGGKVKVNGQISSQFLTALLMAAPRFSHDTEIEIVGELVSKPYIDITINVLNKFGIQVENKDYQRFFIKAGQTYVSPERIMVEGDASSASYFVGAAAISGGKLKINGIGKDSVQGDTEFANVVASMGAKVTWGEDHVLVEGGELSGLEFDANAIPDAAMTFATMALFAKDPVTLRNIYNWRVKETDRLYAMATELKKLGAQVEEGEDYIKVWPTSQIKHAEIETYNDHRIAMCFSLVAVGGYPVTILDPNCVSKTFPQYFQVLKSISQGA